MGCLCLAMEITRPIRATIWDLPDDIAQAICDLADPLGALSLLAVLWRGDPALRSKTEGDVMRHFQRHRDACAESPALDTYPMPGSEDEQIAAWSAHSDHIRSLMPPTVRPLFGALEKDSTRYHSHSSYLRRLAKRTAALTVADIVRCPARALGAFTVFVRLRWLLYTDGRGLDNASLEHFPLPRIADPVYNAIHPPAGTPEEDHAFLIALAVAWTAVNQDHTDRRDWRERFAAVRARYAEETLLRACILADHPEELVAWSQRTGRRVFDPRKDRTWVPTERRTLWTVEEYAQHIRRNTIGLPGSIEAGLLLAPDDIYRDADVCRKWFPLGKYGPQDFPDVAKRVCRLGKNSPVIFVHLASRGAAEVVRLWQPPAESYPRVFALRPYPGILCDRNYPWHWNAEVLDLVGWEAVLGAFLSSADEIEDDVWHAVLRHFCVSRRVTIDRERGRALVDNTQAIFNYARHVADFADVCASSAKAQENAFAGLLSLPARYVKSDCSMAWVHVAAAHIRSPARPLGSRDYATNNTFLELLGRLKSRAPSATWQALLDAVIDDCNRNSGMSPCVRAARVALAHDAIARGCPCTAFAVVTYDTVELRLLRCVGSDSAARIMDEVFNCFRLGYGEFYRDYIVLQTPYMIAAKRVAAARAE